jgi:hypothetical protein
MLEINLKKQKQYSSSSLPPFLTLFIYYLDARTHIDTSLLRERERERERERGREGSSFAAHIQENDIRDADVAQAVRG